MPKKRNNSTENPKQTADEDAIVKRLNIIIHLLLRQVEPRDTTEAARTEIKMLRDLGLTNVEIATVLGKSEGYIGSALSKLRKKRKK